MGYNKRENNKSVNMIGRTHNPFTIPSDEQIKLMSEAKFKLIESEHNLLIAENEYMRLLYNFCQYSDKAISAVAGLPQTRVRTWRQNQDLPEIKDYVRSGKRINGGFKLNAA